MALGSDVWVVVYSGGAFCVVVVVYTAVCVCGVPWYVARSTAQQCWVHTVHEFNFILSMFAGAQKPFC